MTIKKILGTMTTTVLVCLSMILSCGMTASAATTLKPTLIGYYGASTSGATTTKITLSSGQTQVVIPVTAEKGQLFIDLSASGLSGGVTVQLYSNSGCTTKVGYSDYLSASSLTSQMKIDIPSAGTYYLKASRSSYYASNADSLSAKLYYYSSNNKTLTNKQWSGTYGQDSNTVIYHKVVVKKTGYLKVEGYGLSSYSSTKYSISNIALYNSNKKILSDNTYSSNNLSSYYGYTTYFGVKKGTYYIGIKYDGAYNLKYTFTSASDKNISTKKKATTLKQGKTAKGLMLATDSGSKTDWYKIKVTKKKKVKITVNSKISGGLKIQLVGKRTSSSMSVFRHGTSTGTTYSKVPKGTYYLKVTKSSGYQKSSGFYTIKWK